MSRVYLACSHGTRSFLQEHFFGLWTNHFRPNSVPETIAFS